MSALNQILIPDSLNSDEWISGVKCAQQQRDAVEIDRTNTNTGVWLVRERRVGHGNEQYRGYLDWREEDDGLTTQRGIGRLDKPGGEIGQEVVHILLLLISIKQTLNICL